MFPIITGLEMLELPIVFWLVMTRSGRSQVVGQ